MSERRLCPNGDSVSVSSACCRHTLARIVALGVAATQGFGPRALEHAWLSFAALLTGFDCAVGLEQGGLTRSP